MNRFDALKVWEDLTRELWPDADVEKSALRIEHQAHVDWLLNDAYDCGCSDSSSLHRPGCPAMKAWEAFDMPEGHAEVGRAFDLSRPTPLGQWAEGAEVTLFGIDPSQYDLYRGAIGNPQPLRVEDIEAAVIRAAGIEVGLPSPQPVINPTDTTDD